VVLRKDTPSFAAAAAPAPIESDSLIMMISSQSLQKP